MCELQLNSQLILVNVVSNRNHLHAKRSLVHINACIVYVQIYAKIIPRLLFNKTYAYLVDAQFRGEITISLQSGVDLTNNIIVLTRKYICKNLMIRVLRIPINPCSNIITRTVGRVHLITQRHYNKRYTTFILTLFKGMRSRIYKMNDAEKISARKFKLESAIRSGVLFCLIRNTKFSTRDNF